MSISLRIHSLSRLTRLSVLVTLALIALCGLARPAEPQAPSLPSIEQHTESMTQMDGFFDLYWYNANGSLFWEISELDTEFLYQISMGSGLGSNPVGIDRGQLRGTHVLAAKRIGPRILLMEPNYGFVAQSENLNEAQAVRDAFAPSVHCSRSWLRWFSPPHLMGFNIMPSSAMSWSNVLFSGVELATVSPSLSR